MLLKESNAFGSFSIKDFEESKLFYSTVLGLDVREPMGQLLLELKGGVHVFLYAKPDHQPATFTVLNFRVSNLEKTMAELKGKGVQFEAYNGKDLKTDEDGVMNDHGMKIAWFKDPSGNILSIIQED